MYVYACVFSTLWEGLGCVHLEREWPPARGSRGADAPDRADWSLFAHVSVGKALGIPPHEWCCCRPSCAFSPCQPLPVFRTLQLDTSCVCIGFFFSSRNSSSGEGKVSTPPKEGPRMHTYVCRVALIYVVGARSCATTNEPLTPFCGKPSYERRNFCGRD